VVNNKGVAMNKQTLDVGSAEAVLAALERKRAEAVQAGHDLTERRSAIALAAHGDGDQAARLELDKVNISVATHTSELASLDAAIAAAQRRLALARAEEDRRKERAQVKQLRGKLKKFAETAHALDAAMAEVSRLGQGLSEALGEIHRAGSNFPTSEQLQVLGGAAMTTCVLRTPWHRTVEFLSPSARRQFGPLVDGWCATIENTIAARLRALDDEQKEEAA
jgi:hypothetical protein